MSNLNNRIVGWSEDYTLHPNNYDLDKGESPVAQITRWGRVLKEGDERCIVVPIHGTEMDQQRRFIIERDTIHTTMPASY